MWVQEDRFDQPVKALVCKKRIAGAPKTEADLLGDSRSLHFALFGSPL